MKDITGQTFRRLTVLKFHAVINRKRYWLCRCECGNEKLFQTAHLTSRPDVISCGCHNRARTISTNTTHGGTRTPEFITWQRMKSRCHSETNPSYPRYGGRGIHVCAEWRHDFAAFLAHIGQRPSTDYSIDRIDNNRGYEPGNVRWALDDQQRLNRRDTGRFLTIEDEPIALDAVAAYLAMPRASLKLCLQRSGVWQ